MKIHRKQMFLDLKQKPKKKFQFLGEIDEKQYL